MGETDSDGYDRADIAEHILLQAEQGLFKVYISSLTLAEVFKPKGYDPLKPTQNQELLAYFEHEFFEMVIVDRDIGLEANRIAAMYGLNPNDAIHTACALRAGCDVVLTWDKPFLKRTIPGVRIERPEKRGQLSLALDEDQNVGQPEDVEQPDTTPEAHAEPMPPEPSEPEPEPEPAQQTVVAQADGGALDDGEPEGTDEEAPTGEHAAQDGPTVRGSGQAPAEHPAPREGDESA